MCSGIVYGETESELDNDSEEQRAVLSGRAEHIALLSSIPFSAAAVGMVVRLKFKFKFKFKPYMPKPC